MAANTFGELFKVTTFGESHGPAMGCVIDGCPAGLTLSVSEIESELSRRRPGSFYGSRDEKDTPQILSGVFEGKTTGSPITILVKNENQNSRDYDDLKDIYRPQHADFTYEAKFGFRDTRGGGRSSARETLCRVAAGAVAKKLLFASGVSVIAWVSEIAGITLPAPGDDGFDFEEIERSPLRIPGKKNEHNVLLKLEELKNDGDSAGGIVSCIARGVPAGLGEPVFDKLDARLAAAILSIGACKGIEFGAGFRSATLRGSEQNLTKDGILGGISTGEEILFKAAFKPTPSIGKVQTVKDREGNLKEFQIKGRHDVCIAPRAVPVVEAMTAITLADFLLLSRCDKV